MREVDEIWTEREDSWDEHDSESPDYPNDLWLRREYLGWEAANCESWRLLAEHVAAKDADNSPICSICRCRGRHTHACE